MVERFDLVIVGGGMGGLNLAALLTAAGKKVVVLEAGARTGSGDGPPAARSRGPRWTTGSRA
jgi:cation diffusion facilitator CzcD-associated flavoprotein CzcO